MSLLCLIKLIYLDIMYENGNNDSHKVFSFILLRKKFMSVLVHHRHPCIRVKNAKTRKLRRYTYVLLQYVVNPCRYLLKAWSLARYSLPTFNHQTKDIFRTSFWAGHASLILNKADHFFICHSWIRVFTQ